MWNQSTLLIWQAASSEVDPAESCGGSGVNYLGYELPPPRGEVPRHTPGYARREIGGRFCCKCAEHQAAVLIWQVYGNASGMCGWAASSNGSVERYLEGELGRDLDDDDVEYADFDDEDGPYYGVPEHFFMPQQSPFGGANGLPFGRGRGADSSGGKRGKKGKEKGAKANGGANGGKRGRGGGAKGSRKSSRDEGWLGGRCGDGRGDGKKRLREVHVKAPKQPKGKGVRAQGAVRKSSGGDLDDDLGNGDLRAKLPGVDAEMGEDNSGGARRRRRQWLSAEAAQAEIFAASQKPNSAASQRLLKQLADFNPPGKEDSAPNVLLPNQRDARGSSWRLPTSADDRPVDGAPLDADGAMAPAAPGMVRSASIMGAALALSGASANTRAEFADAAERALPPIGGSSSAGISWLAEERPDQMSVAEVAAMAMGRDEPAGEDGGPSEAPLGSEDGGGPDNWGTTPRGYGMRRVASVHAAQALADMVS